MGRQWKNLGEVPDSDDEQGDSQEQEQQEQHGQSDGLARAVGDASHEPAWHESDDEIDLVGQLEPEQDEEHQSDGQEERQEHGQGPIQERQEHVQEYQHSQQEEQQQPEPLVQTDPPQDHPPSDEPPQPPPEPQQPPADQLLFSSQSSLSSLSSLTPFPSLTIALSPPRPSPSPTNATPTASAQPPRPPSPSLSFPTLPDSPPRLRYGFVRELRPRKPIQQHPYLLENAQYTHFMKSHGVKPIRVAYPSATPTPHHGRPAPEEDSQEQEFIDDAEPASQPPRARQDAGPRADSLYDFPTSPLGHGSASRFTAAAMLSTPTRTASTDRTSFLDDDDDDDERFPSPNIRVPGSGDGGRHVARRRGSSPTADTASAPRVKRARIQAAVHNPVYVGSSPERRSPSPVVLLRHRRAITTVLDDDDDDDGNGGLPPSHRRTIHTVLDDDDDNDDDNGASPARSQNPSPERDDDSSSDSGVVRNHSKRIRGVLPASWLRIGQAAERGAVDAAPVRRPALHADPGNPRKGVAQPRQHTASASLPAAAFLFDESDSDHGRPNSPHAATPWPEDDGNDDGDDAHPPYQVIDDEDLGSVMEEDVIDRMGPPGEKRSATAHGGPRQKRRRTQPHPNPFRGRPSQKTRQPKITSAFDRAAAASDEGARRQRRQQRHRHRPAAPARHRTPSSLPPPLLSILDVLEPAVRAPDFIRIAARTARARRAQGKASPSRKLINLGSRRDNRDALSVLQAWRAGAIQPRTAAPPPLPRAPRAAPRTLARTASGTVRDALARTASSGAAATERHRPLSELSPNLGGLLHRTYAAVAAASPPHPPKEPNEAGPRPAAHLRAFVNTASQRRRPQPPTSQQEQQQQPQRQKERQPHDRAAAAARVRPPPMGAVMRPAQLEMVVPAQPGRSAFVAKKRALDEMYRRRRKDAALLPDVRLERFFDDAGVGGDDACRADSNDTRPGPAETADGAPHAAAAQRSRFRKRYNPRQLDTTAARFVHALDPIPLDLAAAAPARGPDAAPAGAGGDDDDGKLHGLGPFGAQYSLHFDIFPLDSGVFFHRSTLLGSGRLAKALGTGAPEEEGGRSGAGGGGPPTFRLDERTLCWRSWDEAASSEYGILFDWLADLLLAADGDAEQLQQQQQQQQQVHAAVDFLVDVIDAVVVAAPGIDARTRQSFVVRSLDVLGGFLDRFPDDEAAVPAATHRARLAALTGVLVVAHYLVRICRGAVPPATPGASPAGRLRGELVRAEDLLARSGRRLAGALVRGGGGLAAVRAAYDGLARTGARGIGRDQQALASWAVLLQVLEQAHVPRAGFWDVAYAALLGNGVPLAACADAGRMEQLWEDAFTLLPLVEVDGGGVVQGGLRRLVPVDGWALPRQALGRVFGLYGRQARQSPSFNAYCRALVGRCHHLVAEWGWARRSAGVLGVVFDFYGSQGFAHLRNEEAYASPAFLEGLATMTSTTTTPSMTMTTSMTTTTPPSTTTTATTTTLSIDPHDKCFHVFLKTLALVVLALRRLGLTNELRNLVARTLPNHNRQYLRERDVHERDLAALRNHHDLLCTLFWAAPPGLRPGLHLLEKLVDPARSHKEAVLINVRAWRQLARFVVAAGEPHGAAFRGLDAWLGRVFHQVLAGQYQSAEADVQRQCARLPAAATQRISPALAQAVAAANRASALDVLQTCVAAALDVLRQSPRLAVATYCLPAYQLAAVLTKMDLLGGGSQPTTTTTAAGWAILDTALDVLDHYLDRLERAMDEQYSSGYDEGDGVDAAEEAVQMLDHKLAKSVFQAARTLTQAAAGTTTTAGARGPDTLRRTAFTERCVVVAARLASRFVHAGVCRLSRFFGAGASAVFAALPAAAAAADPQRRFVPLFVAAVLQHNVFDFQDVGASLLELWLLALVKPRRLLAYELRLAAALQQHGLPYVRGAAAVLAAAAATATAAAAGRPTYDTNRALFACAVASMRQQLRDEDHGGGRRQQLRSAFARALRRVMQQMKDDLADEAAAADHGSDPRPHADYVAFVRGIVALIKSHGGDMCALDPFFYQATRAYAPSPEDPQLQTAGLVAYGLRLAEGEATAGPQLFHYLHNAFHVARAHGQLAGARAVLARAAAAHRAVLLFLVERMVPAILRAAAAAAAGPPVPDDGAVWALLGVYGGAVAQVLAQPAAGAGVPRDIFYAGDGGGAGGGDGAMEEAVVGLLEDVVAWLPWAAAAAAGAARGPGLWAAACARLRAAGQVAALAQALQPTLLACAFLALPAALHARLAAALAGFAALADAARAGADNNDDNDDNDDDGLLAVLAGGDHGSPPAFRGNTAPRHGAQVALFSKTLVQHAQANGRPAGTAPRPATGPTAAAATADGADGADNGDDATPGPQTASRLVARLRQQLAGWTLTTAAPQQRSAGRRRRWPTATGWAEEDEFGFLDD